MNAAGCGSTMKTYGELLARRPGVGRAGARVRRARARRHRDARRPAAAGGAPADSGARRIPRRLSPRACARQCAAEPRALLQTIPGLTLVPLAEPDICCGSAGIFNLVQPEMAATLGRRKAAHIADAGAGHGRHVEPGLHPADSRSAARRRQPAAGDSRRRAARPIDTVQAEATSSVAPQRSASSAPSASCTMEAVHDRDLRHDPARRHAGRRRHLLGRRQAAHRRAARRLRRALHRGRLARLEPARTSSSSSRRSTGRSAARGWRRSDRRAARTSRVDARRAGPAAARRRHAGRHHLRQDLAAARPRGPADDPRREPRDDRRHRALPESSTASSSSTTPSTPSTAARTIAEYALATWQAAERARRRRRHALRHERRVAAGRDRRDHALRARQHLGVRLGIHTHDDIGLGVANALAALDAGATHVQGTLNGYGERTGNCNLTSVMPILEFKYRTPSVPPESLAQLKELSQFLDETANLRPNPRLPWVGAAAFSHKGGTHVNAVQKVIRSYEHIDPGARRQRAARADQRSRRAQQHRHEGARARASTSPTDTPQLREMLARIKELEHQGYEFEAADGSLALLIRRALTTRRRRRSSSTRITSRCGAKRTTSVCEATVKVRVGEESGAHGRRRRRPGQRARRRAARRARAASTASSSRCG